MVGKAQGDTRFFREVNITLKWIDKKLIGII